MKFEVESIVHFQTEEAFFGSTNQQYEDLTDEQLFSNLSQWWYPGEHEVTQRDSEDFGTSFLGSIYIDPESKEIFLLARQERGLVIGLSRIIDGKAIEAILEIETNNQYIFDSFEDDRIPAVERVLRLNNIDYASTSQIGSDLVIGTEGCHLLKNYFNKSA